MIFKYYPFIELFDQLYGKLPDMMTRLPVNELYTQYFILFLESPVIPFGNPIPIMALWVSSL